MQFKDAKLGDTIFFREHWSGMCRKAIIVEICVDDNGEKYWKVNGDFGTTWQYPKNCYFSYQACINAMNAKDNEMVQKYKEEINSIDDMLIFALNHTISCAEEYTDWNARKAFIERGKELGYNLT